jgi:hypothetical protein
MVAGQAEDALVEQHVVERAEAEAVVDGVRAVEGEPADVRGVQADRTAVVQASLVPAERALISVGTQDCPPECGIPAASERGAGPAEISELEVQIL